MLATATRGPARARTDLRHADRRRRCSAHPAQIGYASLVAERLGHTLAKGHTRTDWTRRPLTPEQLQYAADDVRYLVPLYLDLRDALRSRGAARLAVRGDARARAARPASHRSGCGVAPAQGTRSSAAAAARDGEVAGAMARGSRDQTRQAARLDSRRRCAARNCGAPARNDCATSKRIRNLPPGVVRRRGEEMMALIERGRSDAANEAAASNPPRPQPQQLALVTKLMNVARETAEHAKISAGAARDATRHRTAGVRAAHRAPAERLATRADRRAAARRSHDSRGWRSVTLARCSATLSASAALRRRAFARLLRFARGFVGCATSRRAVLRAFAFLPLALLLRRAFFVGALLAPALVFVAARRCAPCAS